MLRIFRERRLLARVVLGVLVGMLALGLIGSTVAWYLEPGRSPSGSSRRDAPEAEQQSEEAELRLLLARYEAMQKERPEDPAVLTGFARVEAELGRFYLEQGRQEEGREFYRRAAGHFEAVLARQEDASLRLELAEVYQAAGSFEQAEEQLRKVLAKDPDNVQAQVQRGLLREARQDWPGAAEIWQALAREGTDPTVREFARARLKAVREKM
ncbi:MAG: tetratricopeptide repeat protein [Firmicutes bacterium]|nr:tetratricopeptide repeat protein [Bacillota bacterium]